MTIKEAIIRSLEDLDRLSNSIEICDHILANNYYEFAGKTPPATVSAQLPADRPLARADALGHDGESIHRFWHRLPDHGYLCQGLRVGKLFPALLQAHGVYRLLHPDCHSGQSDRCLGSDHPGFQHDAAHHPLQRQGADAGTGGDLVQHHHPDAGHPQCGHP